MGATSSSVMLGKVVSALLNIPVQAAFPTEGFGAGEKDAQIEQGANAGMVQQPKTFDKNEWARLKRFPAATAGVRKEIIARDRGGLATLQSAEDALEQGPLDGFRVIEIEALAFGESEVRRIRVKVIQRERGGVSAEFAAKAIREPAFAGAAAAYEGYEFTRGSWIHEATARGVGSIAPANSCSNPLIYEGKP